MKLIIIIGILLGASQAFTPQIVRADSALLQYQVEPNENLMQISFKIYGDYRKWKEIAALNPKLTGPNFNLTGVELINFQAPETEFVWNPLGEPYVIQKGDTLGGISTKLYGTSKRWHEIYENNLPMIRWTNLIFEGFTIYYIPDPAK